MRVQAFCDGGCRNNQSDKNIGGWGVYLVWGSHDKKLYGAAVNTTNNKMELQAAIEALRAIKNKNVGVDLSMDSAYVYNGITKWIFGWQKNGWKNSKKQPVANKDLWLELIAEKKRFSDLAFYKVEGHADNEGNNMADALVNQAMDELSASMAK
jgi:ribonuclease HI